MQETVVQEKATKSTDVSLSGNGKTLVLDKPRVMGILNVTPDSFSDGGRFSQVDAALQHVEKMLASGADIIDVGGESTRPNAKPVTLEEEYQRTIPIIEAIHQRFDTFVSIDTSRAEIMQAAADVGVNLINDVRALTQAGALKAAAQSGLPVCLMHMQGTPKTMQDAPIYDDVVKTVTDYLQQRRQVCIEAGIDVGRIVFDPGFGFGKMVEHNFKLLKNIDKIKVMGQPVLVGMSRKSMIGAVLNNDVNERLIGSVTLAAVAALKNSDIIRVHDVAETTEALALIAYMKNS